MTPKEFTDKWSRCVDEDSQKFVTDVLELCEYMKRTTRDDNELAKDNKKLEVERNRYKAALETIAKGSARSPYVYGSFAHADWVKGVAQRSLDESKGV